MTLKEKRDLVHYIGGGFIAYIFGFITAMYSYVGIGNGIKTALALGVVAGFFGFIFDWLQEFFKVSKFDLSDVLKTGIGGLVGAILLFIVASKTIAWIMFIILFVTLCYEGYFNFYKKLNK
jgi:hypothetical protein